MVYESLLRPWLFGVDPEEAHERVTSLLALVQAVPFGARALALAAGHRPEGLGTSAFGLTFPNPVGLAAGFDKHCRLSNVLPALGFGFLELGTVTLQPQAGNPRPRIFRLPEHQAIVNRLGFNSAGAAAAARSLRSAGRCAVPLGVNIGLNAATPREQAPEEYGAVFAALEPFGDYFAVNVSSPNTSGLRELQEKFALERVLGAIQLQNRAKKPVLVKLAPDLSDEALDNVLDVATRMSSGVIATNTTVARDGLPTEVAQLRGGLSGAPLRARSTAMIRRIWTLTSGKLPIVGVGGVFSGGDAFEKIRAGACLVQVYTGLVYRGPGLPLRILRELRELLDKNGFDGVAQAIGTGAAEAAV